MGRDVLASTASRRATSRHPKFGAQTKFISEPLREKYGFLKTESKNVAFVHMWAVTSWRPPRRGATRDVPASQIGGQTKFISEPLREKNGFLQTVFQNVGFVHMCCLGARRARRRARVAARRVDATRFNHFMGDTLTKLKSGLPGLPFQQD